MIDGGDKLIVLAGIVVIYLIMAVGHVRRKRKEWNSQKAVRRYVRSERPVFQIVNEDEMERARR